MTKLLKELWSIFLYILMGLFAILVSILVLLITVHFAQYGPLPVILILGILVGLYFKLDSI